jgi:chemotaxis-related protein WspB
MLLLTFIAGADRYAVDVARVVELVPRVELRPVPHAPAHLAGLLGYRGHVVPVIDLGLLLGAAPCQERLSTRIILVDAAPGGHNGVGDQPTDPAGAPGLPPTDPSRRGRLLGLIAERVSDLVRVDSEQVVPAPVHLPRAPYLDAIARTDQGIVPLIDIPKLSWVVSASAREAVGAGDAEC